MAASRPDPWSFLPPHQLQAMARAWLDEDAPTFDPTSGIIGRGPRLAQLLCSSPGVLAGSPLAEAVFGVTGCEVTWRVAEGSPLPPQRTVVAEVKGPGASLLLAERVALNLLGRCSGVATVAAKAVSVAQGVQWGGVIAGTRKTTPGFRLAEKYALEVGGADPHRHVLGGGGLLLLKDNHLAAARAPLEQVVEVARRAGGFTRRLGVECSTQGEAMAAAGAGADIVLLDNFTPQELHATAAVVKAAHPRVTLEASGGINLETLPQFLGPHIDVISMGCLTHSAPALDFSLRVLGPGEGDGDEGTC